MIDAVPQENFCEFDYDPLHEVIDACSMNIARVGDDLAVSLHLHVFGLHPAMTPWAAYCTTVVHGFGVTMHPSHRLIQYASLLSRAGVA